MRKIALRILARLIPRALRWQLKVFRILAIDLGQWRSIKERLPVDKESNPIPWYTYPCIEYLKRMDISDKSVFEWGTGNSSLFWAGRAREVVSVEHDKEWFSIVNARKLGNQILIFAADRNEYIMAILGMEKKFDIIVIDGKYSRYECSKNALKCLNRGGIIILDNSDWCPETAKMLREYGLSQIDFSGFGPVCTYTWTTSLFLSVESFNSFCFNQPLQPIGGLRQFSDELA